MKKLVPQCGHAQTATGKGVDVSPRTLLSPEDIKKFQALYQEEYGVAISEEDAFEQGIKLLTLMRCVYKPMTQEEANVIDLHRIETADYLIRRLNVE